MVEKKSAHLEITLRPGAWVDPAAMVKAIEDGGYGARRAEIRLTLTGSLRRSETGYLLVLEDVKPGPQTFRLVGEARLLETLVGKSVAAECAWQPGGKGERPQLRVLAATAAP